MSRILVNTYMGSFNIYILKEFACYQGCSGFIIDMFICSKLSCWTETIEWCMCRLRYGLLPANGKPGSMCRLSEQLKDVGHTVHCWIGLQKYAPVLYLQVSQTTKNRPQLDIVPIPPLVFALYGVTMGQYCAISDIRPKLILNLNLTNSLTRVREI